MKVVEEGCLEVNSDPGQGIWDYTDGGNLVLEGGTVGIALQLE